MKYYLHDSNAFSDEKISELFNTHGFEGLGLYYTLLEKLAAQEKPIKTAVLKRQLYVGKKLEKVWSFMEKIELISSKDDHTFSVRIISYIESYKKKREDTKKRVEQYRDNQDDADNVTRNKRVRNAPKGNVSKGKVKKGDTNVSPEGGGDQATPEEDPFKVKTDGGGRMVKPTRELLVAYFVSKFGLSQSAAQDMGQEMFEYYGSKGWKVGRDPMTNWNLTASRWYRKNKPGGEYAAEEAAPSGRGNGRIHV